MRVIIPMFLIDSIKQKAKNSFVSLLPFQEKGYITLYNKNNNKNYRFKLLQQSEKYFGYECEVYRIPNYFKNVIIKL